MGREQSTPSRLPSLGWGSETATMLTGQLPSQLGTRRTPTTTRRGRPQSPAPPPPSHNPPSLFSRGRRGGPPHQKLPPDNHWPGLFGLNNPSSPPSSSSSLNCLDSRKNKIKIKSPKKETSSSSIKSQSQKEERKYVEERKEEKVKKMKKEEEVRRHIASPSPEERKKEAPGGSSSSSESKFCIINEESYLPRPWLETVPGPPCAIRIMVDLVRFIFITIHTIINIIRSFQGSGWGGQGAP